MFKKLSVLLLPAVLLMSCGQELNEVEMETAASIVTSLGNSVDENIISNAHRYIGGDLFTPDMDYTSTYDDYSYRSTEDQEEGRFAIEYLFMTTEYWGNLNGDKIKVEIVPQYGIEDAIVVIATMGSPFRIFLTFDDYTYNYNGSDVVLDGKLSFFGLYTLDGRSPDTKVSNLGTFTIDEEPTYISGKITSNGFDGKINGKEAPLANSRYIDFTITKE